MPVNTEQWHVSIGLFQSKPSLKTSSKFRVLRFVKVIAFLVLLLLSHGDIEVNPGSNRKISKFSCCHWNVNSILAYDKLSLTKSYNTVQKYDIICISETFLDSSANESSCLIPGYHLLRADHLNNLKKGGVCLYFKENLSFLLNIDTANTSSHHHCLTKFDYLQFPSTLYYLLVGTKL